MSVMEQTKSVEIWAGLECTVNRVNETYFDQCLCNGHDLRLDDLERFKALGIKRLRYPVLWEKTVRGDDPNARDWRLSDRALAELQRLGLPIIAGLVHHGSGPKFTSLVDPDFPRLLADYARSVIERYPHLDAFTPVNEPLTTARFSGLYGVWYPHGKSDELFLKTLVNEVKASILAMRAIRELRPSAELIWTEDFGRAQGTEKLRYQVEFENHRRFLSLDLLMGRVTDAHPLFRYLTEDARVSESDLVWFKENAMSPDLIGINHYPLSNRYLDERLELFPSHLHGGNGKDQYADVGAIDTNQCPTPEPADIYRDVWEHTQIPIAVTEAHISGGRERQLRWLDLVWRGCQKLRSEGCDLRAVTVWSLLGAFDWRYLCTVDRGFYEPGVFDVRSEKPRPTQIARMVAELAAEGEYTHPVLRSEPVLVFSHERGLGRAFAKACDERRIASHMVNTEADRTPEAIEALFKAYKPWAMILDGGSLESVRLIAKKAKENRTPLLLLSAMEEGADSMSREGLCIETHGQPLIVRSGPVFSAESSRYSDPSALVRVGCGSKLDCGTDTRFSPVHLPDLVESCLDLLIDGETGRISLSHEVAFTKSDWDSILHQSLDGELSGLALRDEPSRSINVLPNFEDAMARFVADLPAESRRQMSLQQSEKELR